MKLLRRDAPVGVPGGAFFRNSAPGSLLFSRPRSYEAARFLFAASVVFVVLESFELS